MPGRHRRASDQLRYIVSGIPSYATYSNNFGPASSPGAGIGGSTGNLNTKAGTVGYGSGSGAPGPGGSFARAGGYGPQTGPSGQQQQQQPGQWMYSYRFKQWFPKPQMYNMMKVDPWYAPKAPATFEPQNDPYQGSDFYSLSGERPIGKQQMQTYTGSR